MDSLQLLHGLKARDDEAFRMMVLTYGRPVYERLLARSGNKELAKEALKTALIDMYSTVSAADSSDPLEALLYRRAERVQEEMLCKPCEQMFFNAFQATSVSGEKLIPVQKAAAFEPGVPADHDAAVPAPEPAGEDAPAPSQPPTASQDALPKRCLRTGVAAAFLSAGILCMLWVIAGLLMDMGLIPSFDLGYSWFNLHIAPWF